MLKSDFFFQFLLFCLEALQITRSLQCYNVTHVTMFGADTRIVSTRESAAVKTSHTITIMIYRIKNLRYKNAEAIRTRSLEQYAKLGLILVLRWEYFL